jgi:hypothetical protein
MKINRFALVLTAKPGGSTLRLLNVDGTERVIKPE